MTKEALNRYAAATHAMQTGVAFEMEIRPQPTEPKHLRVGVNSALVDSSVIARLLMDKGIITVDEYEEALAVGMEAEKARYEAHLTVLLGKPVKLG